MRGLPSDTCEDELLNVSIQQLSMTKSSIT